MRPLPYPASSKWKRRHAANPNRRPHFRPASAAPFLVRHPKKYAELLAAKMKQHQSRVWLMNTGWGCGSYGAGKRISLKNTRAIIEAIHRCALATATTPRNPVLGFDVLTQCPGVA
jgi:phosphoenolpyruvate carboxykinase (ATP)